MRVDDRATIGAIVKYKIKYGYAPAYDELMEMLNLKSKASITYRILRLANIGVLHTEHEGYPRALSLVNEWRDMSYGSKEMYECSICNEISDKKTKFCPHCGSFAR